MEIKPLNLNQLSLPTARKAPSSDHYQLAKGFALDIPCSGGFIPPPQRWRPAAAGRLYTDQTRTKILVSDRITV
jgi:hypothetical protein